mmetsp:Transcript_39557/g.80706  ORF Transcript_39557/g.80706 Transcript_39557/m.80706 type:complete len:91 (-) Transcript_39557:557-829(-)
MTTCQVLQESSQLLNSSNIPQPEDMLAFNLSLAAVFLFVVLFWLDLSGVSKGNNPYSLSAHRATNTTVRTIASLCSRPQQWISTYPPAKA